MSLYYNTICSVPPSVHHFEYNIYSFYIIAKFVRLYCLVFSTLHFQKIPGKCCTKCNVRNKCLEDEVLLCLFDCAVVNFGVTWVCFISFWWSRRTVFPGKFMVNVANRFTIIILTTRSFARLEEVHVVFCILLGVFYLGLSAEFY